MQKKLLPLHQKSVIQKISEFYTDRQIVEWLKDEHNITISQPAISYYRVEFKKEIDTIKTAWLNKLSDEPGANKRFRLHELYNLYSDCLKKLQTLPADDISNTKDGKTIITLNNHKIKQQYIREMRGLLEQMRKEMEGQRITFQGQMVHKYDDATLISKAKEIIDLIDYEDAEIIE